MKKRAQVQYEQGLLDEIARQHLEIQRIRAEVKKLKSAVSKIKRIVNS